MAIPVEYDVTSTFDATSPGGESWFFETQYSITTTGLGIDASGTATGRTLTVKGHMTSTSGPLINVGDAGIAESDTEIKIDILAHLLSGGKGIVTANGGLDFLNVGYIETVSTLLQLTGINNIVNNSGTMLSTSGSAIVSDGAYASITNNNLITAELTGIESSGANSALSNNEQLLSLSGIGIDSRGDDTVIANNSNGLIKSELAGVRFSGDRTSFDNNNRVVSLNGNGVEADGLDARVTNTDRIVAADNGILSAGYSARIVNNGVVVAGGAAVFSTGDGATILNTVKLKGATAVQSTGDDVRIVNDGTFLTTGVAIVSTGADAVIINKSYIESNMALSLDGVNADVTNFGALVADSTAIKSIGDHATILNQSFIDGKTAFNSSGQFADFTNNGTITARRTAIISTGDDATIVNNAVLKGKVAFYSTGDDAHLTNGHIASGTSKTDAAVQLLGTGTTYFTNTHEVHARSGTVIQGGNGVEVIRNTHWLDGNVSLGGGDDVFNTIYGDVSGIVRGGRGNDTYVIDDLTRIREGNGQGIDTVKSVYDYTLGDNFENLVLTSKYDTTGKGNNLANDLKGGKGDNALFGFGGRDHLDGGSGDDRLTGGGGKDLFVFENDHGKDTVTDFENGKDHIEVHDFGASETARYVVDHAIQKGADVILRIGSDRMVLEDFRLGQLSTDDFLF